MKQRDERRESSGSRSDREFPHTTPYLPRVGDGEAYIGAFEGFEYDGSGARPYAILATDKRMACLHTPSSAWRLAGRKLRFGVVALLTLIPLGLTIGIGSVFAPALQRTDHAQDAQAVAFLVVLGVGVLLTLVALVVSALKSRRIVEWLIHRTQREWESRTLDEVIDSDPKAVRLSLAHARNSRIEQVQTGEKFAKWLVYSLEGLSARFRPGGGSGALDLYLWSAEDRRVAQHIMEALASMPAPADEPPALAAAIVGESTGRDAEGKVACPGCAKPLRPKPGVTSIRCPRCSTQFEIQ